MQSFVVLGHPRGLRHRVETRHRVVDVGRQRHEHARNLVAQLARHLVRPGRDRDDGDEGRAQRFVARLEQPPQAARDDRRHHVGHGRLEDAADQLDVVEGNRKGRERFRFETAPLNDVRGPAKNPGGGRSPRPESSCLCRPSSAIVSTPTWIVPSVSPGWRASDPAAWRSTRTVDGSGSGRHSGGSSTTRDRGERSRKAARTRSSR